MTDDYTDPVTGKRPQDMDIVEWCDWEFRARQDLYAAKRNAIKQDKIERREARVEHIEGLLRLLNMLSLREVAEKIDQANYPEAWGIPVSPSVPRGERIAKYMKGENA